MELPKDEILSLGHELVESDRWSMSSHIMIGACHPSTDTDVKPKYLSTFIGYCIYVDSLSVYHGA
jgi:hypothetical protein